MCSLSVSPEGSFWFAWHKANITDKRITIIVYLIICLLLPSLFLKIYNGCHSLKVIKFVINPHPLKYHRSVCWEWRKKGKFPHIWFTYRQWCLWQLSKFKRECKKLETKKKDAVKHIMRYRKAANFHLLQKPICIFTCYVPGGWVGRSCSLGRHYCPRKSFFYWTFPLGAFRLQICEHMCWNEESEEYTQILAGSG